MEGQNNGSAMEPFLPEDSDSNYIRGMNIIMLLLYNSHTYNVIYDVAWSNHRFYIMGSCINIIIHHVLPLMANIKVSNGLLSLTNRLNE